MSNHTLQTEPIGTIAYGEPGRIAVSYPTDRFELAAVLENLARKLRSYDRDEKRWEMNPDTFHLLVELTDWSSGEKCGTYAKAGNISIPI